MSLAPPVEADAASARPLRLLLVDDEAIVLRSVERLLHSAEPTWEIRTAATAEQAVSCLERHPLDVVVTDLNLGTPGMSGAELLAFVQERHPEIVRIVLSGNAGAELAQRSVPMAHLLLTKPFEPLQLRAQLRRATELCALMSDGRVRALVGSSNRLPSPPKLFHDIAVALSSRRTNVEDVAALIERDVALTAQLIRVVSSAFFGLPRRVRSARGAVAYLGFNTVKTLVLSASIVEQFRLPRQVRGLDLEALQRHGLVSAHLARQILTGSGSAEAAFSAAMLQNVGQLLLASRAPDEYAQVLIQAREGRPAELAERAVFGVSHAEVGAYLLSIWGLPQNLVSGVLRHHAAQRRASARLGVVLSVNLAQKLALDPDAPADDDPADDPRPIDLGQLRELGVAERLGEWRAAARRFLAEPEGQP